MSAIFNNQPRIRAVRARWHFAGVGLMALGAAAAALAVSAAPATAEILGPPSVSPGISVGLSTKFGTTCSYTVTVKANPYDGPVSIYDNGPASSFDSITKPGAETVDFTWTPLGAGNHQIVAYQGMGAPQLSAPIPVARGLNLGSSCAVLPF